MQVILQSGFSAITNTTPCTTQSVCQRCVGCTSAFLVHKDHSSCTAEMGCMACARLISSGVASDRPRYLTLPDSTSFCTNSPFALSQVANELCSEVLVHKQTQSKWGQADVSLINSHSETRTCHTLSCWESTHVMYMV